MKRPDWDNVIDTCSGDVRRLSYSDRYTTIPVTCRENVAEHSYWVALYALFIHRELGEPEELTGLILAYALIHDLVECRSGDLVRTFKYLTPELKSAVSNAEGIIERGMPDLIRAEFSAIEMISDLKQRAYVKAVVKTADFISLHQYLIRELNRGNVEIQPFIIRMQNDLIAIGMEMEKSEDGRIAVQAEIMFKLAKITYSGRRTA